MELKRTVAQDSHTALKNVRREHGENALIVSTNKIGQKTEIIYAVDGSEGTERATNEEIGVAVEVGDDFASAFEKEQFKASPDRASGVNGLISEIKEEIEALKQKMEKETFTNENQAIGNICGLEREHLREKIALLSNKAFADQIAWGQATILVGCSDVATWMARSGLRVNGADKTLLATLHRCQESTVARNLTTENSEENTVSGRPILISSPNLNNLRSLLPQHSSKFQTVVALDNLRDRDEAILSSLGEELTASIFYCLNCDQSLSSIKKDLTQSPNNTKSLILSAPEISDITEEILDWIAAGDWEVSGLLITTNSDIK